MEKLSGLRHLFMTVFLFNFATFMVIPAITDVTMAALCPGRDECSIAIYLTGFQQVIIGLGTLVMMPLVGNLSDMYGRKALLTIPMCLTIIPLAILAWSRSRNFFYAYFVLKTLTSMVCEGSVHCLTLAYVADNIPEIRRASAFGVLSGVGSSAFVCGTLSARFLKTSSTFQVAASVAAVAAVYMKLFLPDSVIKDGVLDRAILEQKPCVIHLDGESAQDSPVFKSMPSLDDMLSLLQTSSTFTKAAIVAFFSNLGDVGLHTSLMYYLKARFHFNKHQFADLMMISGIAGTISQLVLMPILAPTIGEEKLLAIGLLFSCSHIRSIASKQVGPSEQGKVQGCISGISSFAHLVSPLAFTPLTALFLSDGAPFNFPGFSIMCIGFASKMTAKIYIKGRSTVMIIEESKDAE
uniref:Major facilitator superfamily (MFS) profile domain-containing protein n=1 Tax=Vitis vinifera TaxID=29760 RepID=A5ALX6_VITVI|nr:hypothetical protein VITISV_038996 [Vitis vinifera]